jgi:hypothetical protein
VLPADAGLLEKSAACNRAQTCRDWLLNPLALNDLEEAQKPFLLQEFKELQWIFACSSTRRSHPANSEGYCLLF